MRKISVKEDILRVKTLIQNPRKLSIRPEIDEILIHVRELSSKIDDLKKDWEKSQTTTSLKRRKQVLIVLKREQMTSTGVGNAMGMSRTRATEYLKKLESEGLVKGEKKGKQKFYSLNKECDK
ncbi:MAG: winged helix-turn-helix transcriptional regulator [Candidatus Altiarchaeota archaeon]|nr:winged helix-turn-helix transcriptional regulator [Candidatus Altiarchaeota archaeon]